MCDVIWLSRKALPSLHCFVSIAARFATTYSTNPNNVQATRKKPRKGETARKKALIKSEAAIELSE